MHAVHSIIKGGSGWLGDLAERVRCLIMAVWRNIQDSRFVVHTAGKFRRLWLVHFQKDYVQRQLVAREGACRQCGACCNLLFTCPMLTRLGKCHIYGLCRPQVCKAFPIDHRDIEEVKLCGGRCGHRFGNAELSSKRQK